MAETMAYPPIEPTTFDLIVVGTGVPESVIAAAASTAGKTVLHLDPNPFYGSHFSSLPLHDLSSFLTSNSQNPIPNPHRPTSDVSDDSGSSSIINLSTRPLYSIIKISEPLEDHQSRKYNVDLAGPRVLFCADSAVDLMLKSNASQYMEFKNVDASLIWDENGKLRSVPDSRSAIFKDKTLAWSEKNQLMSFFKLVQGHFEAVGSAESSETISKEDLESPFAAFLNKMRLPPKIKSIILYAIAMADYDQDAEVCKDVLKTKDGINRLVLHHSSIGRFPNALGALIYPIYGQGELPQAFCRRAAVKGCLYVLRMPVVALLVDKGSGSYKGVKLASGQELFSQKLVLEPSITVSSPMANSSFQDSSLVFGLRDVKGKVARGICITKTPVKPDVSSCLVFFPPKSLYPGQVASIRVLQLASSLAVCPSGMYVCYISALCEDAIQGEELLNAAVNALFLVPIFGSSESISTEKSENSEEVEPTLLWNALYVHEMTMGSFGSVSSTPMPDVNLNYNDVLHATAELFQKMYPGEEFFLETTPSDKPEADGGIIDTEESL